jgi:drug/metabolite transporter (DMT)-like permease
MLVVLAGLWGASFLFIRVAVDSLGPLALADVRVLLAGGALLVAAPLMGVAWKRGVPLRAWLVLGAVNAAIPFALIAFAETHITSSLAAIINATTPLFGALVAALWLGERLDRVGYVGLLLGLVGVGIVVGLDPGDVSFIFFVACGASLTASCLYGIGANYVRRSFKGVAPVPLSIGQLFAAGAVLTPLIPIDPPSSSPPLNAIACMLGLSLGGTALAYLLYFRLLDEVGATKSLTVTFMVPPFAVVWGRVFLGEPLGAGLFIGAAVILVGVALVTGWRPGRGAPAPDGIGEPAAEAARP